MKAKTWEDVGGKWGWSIFDEYGDEIASSDESWPTRAEARQEMYAALADFE